MADDYLIQLIEKYLAGEASAAEKAELEDWFENLADGEKVFYQGDPGKIREAAGRSLAAIRKRIPLPNEARVIELTPKRRFAFAAVAASILVFLSVGVYFYAVRHKPAKQTAQNFHNDVPPGTNKAILTLSGGKQIVVTGATNGTLARQANIAIRKSAGAQLTYAQTNQAVDGTTVMMNTLSTQTGAESGVTLSDGTEVRLDAASSITYPVNFTGKDRRVTVTGQAYFKVKYNPEHPFYVTTGGQTTQDLGTEFNINAYPDEPAIVTTLLEGSIQVSSLAHLQPLKLVPGQQAVSENNNLKIEQGEPEAAASWANGYFLFNDVQITGIMKQLTRWYNIEVIYEGKVPDIGFNGTVSRYKSITQVLQMLETTKAVHFKIEGRRVTVMP